MHLNQSKMTVIIKHKINFQKKKNDHIINFKKWKIILNPNFTKSYFNVQKSLTYLQENTGDSRNETFEPEMELILTWGREIFPTSW